MSGRTWLIISVFLLLMVSTATAEIIFVDADASGANNGSSWTDAYRYLQNGLAAALGSDEIWVAQGLYKPDEDSAHPNGTGSRTATFRLKDNVDIKGGYAGFGQPDPNVRDIELYETILSGDLLGDDGPDFANNRENSYHVVTGSGTNATALLDGFTISGGNANGSNPYNHGGGMYNWMYNYRSSPTVTNCTFSGNSALSGGGMFNLNGSPVLTNCTFNGNRASAGGGMYNSDSSSPTLTNCIFIGNSAGAGGGIYGYGFICSPALTSCIFIGNLASSDGGGMHNYGGRPTFTNCIFSGNSAGRDGGGMFYPRSDPVLSNCTFSGNSAGQHGGGICCKGFPTFGPGPGPQPEIAIGTIVGNTDTGIFYESSDVDIIITNCIIWDNEAPDGPEIYLGFSSNAWVSYSDVQGGWPGEGNIDTDPYFVELGYWDVNVVWVDGDYHLQSQAGRWDPNQNDWVYDANTSPCIDAGNPGCPLGNEPATNDNRRNMGAYGGTAEASKTPANWRSIADLTNDWTVDFNDLKVFVDYWLETGECIPSDLTRNQSVDFADFAIMALHWLECTAPECD